MGRNSRTPAPAAAQATALKAGDSLPFFAPFTTACPKCESVAMIDFVNEDGTVNVTTADNHATPYNDVPVIAQGAEHPANGPFAIAPPTLGEQTAADEGGEL